MSSSDTRKLVVCIPGLAEKYRERIQETATNCGFDVSFFESEQEAMPAAQEAEVIFASSNGLCSNAPNLRWMCASFAGVDHLVKPGVLSEDVILTNSSGAYGVTISEHIVMVTLEMMRRSMEYREIVNRREWIRDLPIRSIYGSWITFLGTGDIGQKTANRFRGFSPEVIVGLNRSGRQVDAFDTTYPMSELDNILPQTDLLVMALPGTPETKGIMNRERLLKLPENAFIVNVGRGSAIDQKAIEEVMREGHLAGAALDVFEEEPLSPESTLWTCPRLLITPHTAGNMTLDHTVNFIVSMFIDNLIHYTKGEEMSSVVDRKHGY